MSTITVTRRPEVAALPAVPRRRPPCPTCGPSFEWETPTAATLALILAMHELHASRRRPSVWARIARVLAGR